MSIRKSTALKTIAVVRDAIGTAKGLLIHSFFIYIKKDIIGMWVRVRESTGFIASPRIDEMSEIYR